MLTISPVDQTCSLTKLQAGQPSNRGSIPGKGKGLLYPYMGVLYLIWNDEKMWGRGAIMVFLYYLLQHAIHVTLNTVTA